MEKQLTNEEISTVYAMYLGQKIMYNNDPKDIRDLICIETPWTGLRSKGLIKLLLKPLSAITDEDAIEVAKLLQFTSHLAKNGKAFLNNLYGIQPLPFHALNTHFVIQYLISKSYAVPMFFLPAIGLTEWTQYN